MELYKVKITNWEKWNAGSKTTEWFKLSTTFPLDPKVMELNNSEFRFFVSLLALAGRSRGDFIQFSRSSMAVECRFSGSSMTVALSKLSKLGLIEIQKERKKEKKERVDSSTEEIFRLNDFDIDPIYKKFPRKQGKQAGYKKLKSIIKTEQQLRTFEQAVEKFAEVMAKENRKPEFIPIFSTFVNSQWQDYLDPEVGTVSNSFAEKQKNQEKEQFNRIWGDL